VTTAFVAAGRRITVKTNGGVAKTFFIKGIDYGPTPICASSILNPLGASNRALWQRDLPQLRALGTNTIKIYNVDLKANDPLNAYLAAAYNQGNRPIYTILSIFFDGNVLLNQKSVNDLASQYRTLATRYGASPDVMGISIGSEVNFKNLIGNKKWWAGMNAIAQAARAGLNQAGARKILTTSMIDDAMKTVKAGEANGFKIDAWGINVYRGKSFAATGLWTQVGQATKKPFIVGEWGSPASYHPNGNPNVATEYPANKRALLNGYMRGLAADLYANSTLKGSTGSGGLVFEWSDEWWKAGNNCKQLATGKVNTNFPDGFNDEAWYGLNRISAGKPNVMTQRTTYATLRAVWNTQPT
jgi:hypothetical protein